MSQIGHFACKCSCERCVATVSVGFCISGLHVWVIDQDDNQSIHCRGLLLHVYA